MTRYMYATKLAAGKRVIDLGCGSGYGSYYLAKHGAKSVLGIDNSKEAIDYCKSRYKAKNLKFQLGNVTRLPKSFVFDVAVAFEVIEHLREYEQFLADVKHHLTRTGMLILSTPNKSTYETPNPFHVKEFYPRQFATLLRKYFRNVTMLHQAYPSTVAIIGGTKSTSSDWEKIDSIPLDYAYPTRKLDKSSLYLIAVCSDSKPQVLRSELFIFEEDTLLLKNYLSWRRWIPRLVKERDRARLAVHRLHRELEEKSTWATKLDEELSQARSRLGNLQSEFEERTQWALRLDRELSEKNRLIAELQAELQRQE